MCSIAKIDPGYKGVPIVWGHVDDETLNEGWHVINWISTEVKEFDVRTKQYTETFTAYTKDMQNSKMSFTINYRLNGANVGELYKNVQNNYLETLLLPPLRSSVKAIIGQWEADKLVSNRKEVESQIEALLHKEVNSKYISVFDLSINDVEFSEAFEDAVERKVISLQKFQEEQNNTMTVKEKARQVEIQAESEAKAMRIKNEALSKNKALIELETINKWDGKLPQNMYGSAPLPFINTVLNKNNM